MDHWKPTVACGLEVPHKITNPYTKGVRYQFQGTEGHALAARFEPVEVDAIQARHIRQLVLGDVLALTDQTNPFPDQLLDVLISIRLLAYAALKHPA